MAYFNGQLLVATPRLIDPNFHRSVILLLDHDEEGALGVVINRPSELPLAEVLPAWADAVAEPRLLFSGGPVSPESALAVGLTYGDGPSDGFKHLIGQYGLVDLDALPETLIPALVGVRVFSGYAGWGAGQLELELAEGSWYVVAAQPGDLLAPDPAQLWRAVLRRQPGELAYVATFPDDPMMN
jgi:putative transcriptional regulator